MKIKNRELVISQLDEKMAKFKILEQTGTPPKGWIRALREALNMNCRQLSDRLGKSRGRVIDLEHDEISGAVTIKRMRRAAEALDCVFVYALVPRTSIKDFIRQQAEIVAKERISKTSHTMFLENQNVSVSEEKKMFSSMLEELTKTVPKTLWDRI